MALGLSLLLLSHSQFHRIATVMYLIYSFDMGLASKGFLRSRPQCNLPCVSGIAAVLLVTLLISSLPEGARGVAVVSGVCPNDCSGHGTCDTNTKACSCLDGFGSASDVAVYKSPDCSLRTCPAGPSLSDVPVAFNEAHKLAECSNAGLCDRTTGKCLCRDLFTGKACQHIKCPKDCSGHGQCKTMARLAQGGYQGAVRTESLRAIVPGTRWSFLICLQA